MTRYNYLLGATESNEIVFVKMDKRERDGGLQFSASFDTVIPFNASEIDFEEYCYNWIDNFDNDTKYEFCKSYDCAPSELGEYIAMNHNIEDIIDCSLYDECFNVDGEDWYFESSCCGQHDTRNEMVEYTNKEAYDIIIGLWDAYHLKQMDESALALFDKVCGLLNPVDEEEWIKEYIWRVFV